MRTRVNINSPLFSQKPLRRLCSEAQQKGETFFTPPVFRSYMRTIPWFSSGSFLENDVSVLRPIMPFDKNRQDNVYYGFLRANLFSSLPILRFVSHKDLNPAFVQNFHVFLFLCCLGLSINKFFFFHHHSMHDHS